MEIEQLETHFNTQIQIIMLRLDKQEEVYKRFESTIVDIQEDFKTIRDSQKEGAKIAIEMLQSVQLLMEAFGGKDGLEKMKKRNERIDASFALKDGFIKTLWNAASKGLAVTLIAAFITGALILLGVNLNSAVEIVPKVRFEATTHKGG